MAAPAAAMAPHHTARKDMTPKDTTPKGLARKEWRPMPDRSRDLRRSGNRLAAEGAMK
jgi:hypothetical protein